MKFWEFTRLDFFSQPSTQTTDWRSRRQERQKKKPKDKKDEGSGDHYESSTSTVFVTLTLSSHHSTILELTDLTYGNITSTRSSPHWNDNTVTHYATLVG